MSRGTLSVILAVCFIFLIIEAVKYGSLLNDAQDACATTGAAAKLDLSSFVPLCKKVNP